MKEIYLHIRERKTNYLSTVAPPNTVDTANEGISKPVPPAESAQAPLRAQAESAQAVNISQGSKFETESAQAVLGAQPLLLNVWPNFDENTSILGGILKVRGLQTTTTYALVIKAY
ncbi:hypothetical protein GIB67_039293 [Kingdonia uniflora]|uniref:Uncharacterized protein n=1 Tax=Kingdonia uniflora TaxID=39325 RepID=A0A7J7MMF2_9MAGN|nr:hypothetical protein GIB67_039293 [Kingdonia uniflora]